MQSRSSETDRKLTSVFGWSIASLAFLVSAYTKTPVENAKIAIATAALFSLVSVIVTGFAIKTRMWRAPSEDDWFKEELWNDSRMMRCYHIVSMLHVHQVQIKHIKTKAECLGLAEICLSVAAVIAFLVLIVPLFF